MQATALSDAYTLGLQVDHIQDLQLDSPDDRPRPMLRSFATAIRTATTPMPVPEMTAAPEDVAAEVSATLVLRR